MGGLSLTEGVRADRLRRGLQAEGEAQVGSGITNDRGQATRTRQEGVA